MTEMKKASWLRKIIGSLLVAIFAMIHLNFIVQNSTAVSLGFVAVLVFMIYKSNIVSLKPKVQHLQYKTLSILSFLLPISAIIYTFIFTSKALQETTSEAEAAGTAIGSAIGGTLVIGLTFVLGLSFGIVFYLMGRKKS